LKGIFGCICSKPTNNQDFYFDINQQNLLEKINEAAINRHKHCSDLPGFHAAHWHVFQKAGA
jgi:hypothetical protein